MLELIKELPAGLMGVRAEGTVSKEDYEQVLMPSLEEARREGRRIRFLYDFGPGFEGFTPGAAWEDTKVGVQYLRLFERCAIVSDIEWIRVGARAVSTVMPCPVRVFENSQWQEAVSWLRARPESSLHYRMLADRRVLVVEPKAKLRAEDFDDLEATVDAWLEGSGGALQGLVLHAHEFPGWKDLSSALRHIRFLRDHHKQIPRVAWAVDSKMAALGPALAKHFVQAEIKRFDADALADAIDWASGPSETAQELETERPGEEQRP